MNKVLSKVHLNSIDIFQAVKNNYELLTFPRWVTQTNTQTHH